MGDDAIVLASASLRRSQLLQQIGVRHRIVGADIDGTPGPGEEPAAYVQGLAIAESEALLDRLWAHAARPELAWYHTWAVGDVVIWDNRCTMHRRNAFDNAARRIMHRTQIKGTRPYCDGAGERKLPHPRALLPASLHAAAGSKPGAD